VAEATFRENDDVEVDVLPGFSGSRLGFASVLWLAAGVGMSACGALSSSSFCPFELWIVISLASVAQNLNTAQARFAISWISLASDHPQSAAATHPQWDYTLAQ
jgi:hypothetical protein